MTNIKNWLFGRDKPAPVERVTPSAPTWYKERVRQRSFDASLQDRLRNSWGTQNFSSSQELRGSLRTMRARSRDQWKNNHYMRRFLKLVSNNVVGPRGIVFQSRAARPDGSADELDRESLEGAFKEWGKRGNCTICGRYSWLDVQRIGAETVARDGEILIRVIRGKAAGNRWNFALQLNECDELDENYFDNLSNGNKIELSVESNKFARPVAYHLTTGVTQRERVPASEIIHVFPSDRFNQARGIPWAHAALSRMKMLDGYEESELVAARVAAAKMGIFTTPDGDLEGDADDGAGNIIMDSEPGSMMMGPEGFKFESWDPTHPTTAFDGFVVALLRGVASGLNISYNSLANDLSNVNFSSLRGGKLDDQDTWRMLQAWFVDNMHDPVFEGWLAMWLASPGSPLPMSKFDKFSARIWQPRGWAWVDPQKEINAKKAEIRGGLISLDEAIAERGRDPQDVYKQIAANNKILDEMGLVLDTDPRHISGAGIPVTATPNNNGAAENDDQTDDD